MRQTARLLGAGAPLYLYGAYRREGVPTAPSNEAFDRSLQARNPEWGLRDLPLGHAQALCASLCCPSCGTLFLDMRFDDAEMARLYADYRGPAYEAERERFEPGYAARNRGLLAGDAHIPAVEAFLQPHLPARPAVLDWGGDTGLNTLASPSSNEAALRAASGT